MSNAFPLSPPALLRDDLLMRVQRRLGLAPPDGLGVVRRAIFWGLFAWLPVAVWALLSDQARSADDAESLLAHYAVTVRLLVAVPLMVVAEGVLLVTILRLVGPQCVAVGVFGGDVDALGDVAARLARLRDRVHPWAAGCGVALGWALSWQGVGPDVTPAHGMSWATGAGAGATGFGAQWYLWVARPIFFAFMVIWLWRTLLLGIALRRLAASGFSLVPTHPDRAGGIGFFASLPAAFGIVAFALSSVIAAGWAHDVAHHDASVLALRVPMIATVVLLTALFLAPLGVLAGPMGRARIRARLQYGALLARHGAGLHRRWIEGRTVEDPVLDAPEIGAAADAATLYDAVGGMRPVPIGPGAVLAVAIPAALPMIAVFAMQVPIGELLGRVIGALL